MADKEVKAGVDVVAVPSVYQDGTSGQTNAEFVVHDEEAAAEATGKALAETRVNAADAAEAAVLYAREAELNRGTSEPVDTVGVVTADAAKAAIESGQKAARDLVKGRQVDVETAVERGREQADAVREAVADAGATGDEKPARGRRASSK